MKIKNFPDIVSDSTLQLNLRNYHCQALLVAKNNHNSEKAIKIFFPFPLFICVWLDFLCVL